MNEVSALAHAYFEAVHAAAGSGVDGEPEAQLTGPVSAFLSGLAAAHGLGALRFVREPRLGRSRPDFAVVLERGGLKRQVGFVELKGPSVGIAPSLWTGRNAEQWAKMSVDAEVLILCNGRAARLWINGESFGDEARLPYAADDQWDEAKLSNLLRRFAEARPSPVTSVSDLSRRLASRTADLRDRLLWLLEFDGASGDTARSAFQSWKGHVHPHSSERDFADGVSQVVTYGMVLAALSDIGADANRDGYITVAEAREAIRSISPVMAAAFAPLVDKPILFAAVEPELSALESLISAIDVRRVNRSADRRGEPWLYFYEDFLAVYDPEERKQAGVYYTPTAIVKAIVNIVDSILVDRIGKRLGFADQRVVTLDPAAGTGTFPLAVIDWAAKRAESERGSAGRTHAATSLSHTLYAFELLPGPYAVAQLRIAQRLKELGSTSKLTSHVVLTDTLESPLDPQVNLPLFGDAEVLAAEQSRAKRIKLEQRVTVILGNPPYRRVEKDLEGRGSGGWVVDGKVPGRSGKASNKSLFDDILDVAKRETVFSHHASLYNLYVYFWRWAVWKAFEAHGDGPAVVAFITASSWLSGPGFVGLRKLVRETCDEVWVLDLGGENQGANPEENVFAIETPVSVVILFRSGSKEKNSQALINYRRIKGSREVKLAAMEAMAASDKPLEGDWLTPPPGWMSSFVPPTGDEAWTNLPLLADIFPWQQPGCMHSRSWPIAPSPILLEERWKLFAQAPLADKPRLYVTPKSGRNVNTRVAGLVPLATVGPGTTAEPRVRYGFRSFDRQWVLEDPRLAKTESPALWDSRSERQTFLVGMASLGISAGPALTVSENVPDKHYFRGSFGGKDVIPLYRDAEAKYPNLTRGLAALISERLSIPMPNVEDFAAYTYSMLSSRSYQRKFATALLTPGLRVPLTADSRLWSQAVELGSELLWLHTWGDRFSGAQERTRLPRFEGMGWKKAVTLPPRTLKDVEYLADEETLRISDGLVTGVRPDVWDYSVSGMQVLKKWIGYRTVKGIGKAATSENPLDRIRPNEWLDEWNDEILDLLRILTRTLDLEPMTSQLLEEISSAPQLLASDLPVPKRTERLAPKQARTRKPTSRARP